MRILAKILRGLLRLFRRFLAAVALYFVRQDRRFLGRVIEEGALKPRVQFAPFDTPACVFQHQVIADTLKRSGHQVNIITSVHDVDEVLAFREISQREIPEFKDFSGVIDYLESLGQDSHRMARGVIDSFIRECPVEVYFGDFRVEASFVNLVKRTILRAETIISESAGVVIGDSAYVANSALVVEAERQAKPCWVLQPEGRFFRATSEIDEDNLDMSYSKLQELADSDPIILRKAEDFFSERIAGLVENDYDSIAAFRGREELSGGFRGRKILFLHAFRDANLVPLRTRDGTQATLFRTYFEWAEFAFSIISERPDEWLIRPHPLSNLFPSDREILQYLISKHQLEEVPLVDDLSTAAVLKAKLPVFTHSGTIALETAASGYRSVVCSRRFPSEFVTLPETIQAFASKMRSRNPQEDRTPLPSSVSSLAALMLYSLAKGNRVSFGAAEPPPNFRRPVWREVQLASQFFQLIGTLRDRDTIQTVDQISREIAEAVRASSR